MDDEPFEVIAVIPENYQEIIDKTADHRDPFTLERLKAFHARAKTVPNGGPAYVFIRKWEVSYGAQTASGDSPPGAP